MSQPSYSQQVDGVDFKMIMLSLFYSNDVSRYCLTESDLSGFFFLSISNPSITLNHKK